MSDEDTKKSGAYRLEYASSGRAKCKGPKPCNGSPIAKGELRLGSQVDFRGNTSFAWRHWGCTTSVVIAKFKDAFDNPDELDGFEELKAVDKERVRKAWEDGKVADEDIPPTAKKTGDAGDAGEDDEKPKKKRAPPKKKARKDEDDGDGEDDEEKPKRKKAASKKEPAARKAPAAKKAPAKKKAAKKDSDSEGENFADEMDKISDDDEDDDDDADAGKKRKRPSPKKAPESKKTKKPAAKKSKKKAISDDEDDDD